MPHFTVIIGSDGPVIDLAIAGGPTWKQLAAPGALASAPLIVRALIDPGADLSAVHPQILRQLGLGTSGRVRIRRPGQGAGFHLAGLTDVELAIGGVGPSVLWIPTRVIGVAPATPTVLALIGRDVLSHCTLFYNGPRGQLTLSC